MGKRYASFWFALLFATLLTGDTHAGSSLTSGSVKVIANLRDGSRIVGTVFPADTDIELQTKHDGKFHIPLNSLNRIEWPKNRGAATVQLLNGEQIRGEVLTEQIDLNTLLGLLNVPIITLSSLKVRGPNVLDTVVLGADAWKALPFPNNSDWPGYQGQLSTIGQDGVNLIGQPVRSIQTYQLPFEIECDFKLVEELQHGGGYLTFNFGVPGAGDHLLPTHMLQLLVVTLTDSDHGKLVTAKYTGDFKTAVIIHEPPCENIQVGALNHIKISMTTKGWSVKLNDAPVVTETFTTESDEVQFDLWNWQPDSHYKVSNFTLRQLTP